MEVLNSHGRIIYRVVSRNPQRGHKVILPWWGFEEITYDIMRVGYSQS
jgi:hypothetical protein